MQEFITAYMQQVQSAFESGDQALSTKSTEQRRVDVIKSSYRAMLEGRPEDFAALLHPDCQMTLMASQCLPIRGHWQGRDAVMAAVMSNMEMLDIEDSNLKSIVAQGNTVVILGHEWGKLTKDSSPYDCHWVQIHTFDDEDLIINSLQVAAETLVV